MNKKILMTMMIIASASSFAASKEIYSKNGNYRVVQSSENIVAIEQEAYQNLLRVVDEQNRKNGISLNYLDRSRDRVSKVKDLVDLIPMANYTNSNNDFKVKFMNFPKSPKNSSELASSFHSAKDLIEMGSASFDKENLEKTGFITYGSEKRFYFGNGNVAKDIKFLSKNHFEKYLEKSRNEVKYIVEGTYRKINSNINQLEISMDEYYSNIEGKSRESVAEFIKDKLVNRNIVVFRKGDEIYTKDEKGEEWRVLWSLEPISEFVTAHTDENKRFKDNIFTKIFIYDSSLNPEDSSGRMIYKRDGSIIAEDKYEYSNDISLKTKNWGAISSISDLAKEAEKKIEKGGKPSTPIEHYFYDKKNLSSDEFYNKWEKTFDKDGEFSRDLANMKQEIEVAKDKLKVIEQEHKEIKNKLSILEEDPRKPKDFYAFTWKYKSNAEKEKYLSTQSQEVRELLEEYIKYYNLNEEKSSESLELRIDIEGDIAKKYGFSDNTWGSAESRKWTSAFVYSDKNVVRELLGKLVEFRGKGKVDGVIDLGEGHNELSIAEQFTGKYGTNIILSPYAKLKNIKKIRLGGQIGNETGVSISGRTSLSLDIDPNIKNEEQHLIQHALKDSDKNIVFEANGSTSYESLNDFSIELMTSKISEDSTINMGRKIHYNTYDIARDEEIDRTITFVSDSIAHTLADNKEYGNDGNSLINVKLKEEIKRLNGDENNVYKSIKNSKKIDLLHLTLTTTNKKTTFSVSDDEKEKKNKVSLAKYLKEENPEKLLEDLSQFNLNEIEKEEAMERINLLKEGKAIKENLKKEAELTKKIEEAKKIENNEEYKKLNLREVYSELNKFNFSALENANEEERKTIVTQIKNIINKLDSEVLKKLKDEYRELEIGSMVNSLENSQNDMARYLEITNPDKWDYKLKVLNKAESLKNSIKNHLLLSKMEIEKSLNQINEELSNFLDSYSHDRKKEYENLKSKLYYTLREEEALQEFKTMLSQLQDTNIYSKMNKVAKNELTTYTNIPFDINRNLSEKKHLARGGYISSRNVQQNFKGNTYTAYGLYEKEFLADTKLGFMVGGSSTNHTLTHNKRTAKTTPATSSSKGISAYFGAYAGKKLYQELNWISGLGFQYGKYDITRNLRNNYQTLTSKGKVDILGLNAYSGLVLDYPLQEDVVVQVKGLLSYSFINQGKVREKEGLNLDINNKNYNYLDTEIGVNFSKTLYDFGVKSNLSAGIYRVMGVYGYKNSNLSAKINGSSHSFAIKGDKVQKDAVKLFIDYNVQKDSGLNYGLDGTYITNSKETDVRFGFKAGYTF